MKNNRYSSTASGLAALVLSLSVLLTMFTLSAAVPSALDHSQDTAEITVCKTMTTSGTEDEYTFRLEPVEAWTNENEDPAEDGSKLKAEEMPMPEDTPAGNTCKEIVIGGLRGEAGNSKTQSFGLIRFSKPGWYMYKITEVVSGKERTDIIYDNNSYYAVVYAEYAEDTGKAVKVSNVTAWHNENNSTDHLPDLSDISSVTDNRGEAAVDNEDINSYGKTDIGVNTVVLDFWNSQETSSFEISKKVTGSMGDITKEFDFTARFTGLAVRQKYSIVNNGAVQEDGFSGEGFETDEEGCAELHFKLKNGTGFSFEGMPVGSEFEITEAKSDHDPGFTVVENDEEIASETMYTRGKLSTGKIMTGANGNYKVEFINKKNAAPATGVAENGNWWIGMGLAAIAAAAAYIYACIRGSIRKKGKPTTFS